MTQAQNDIAKNGEDTSEGFIFPSYVEDILGLSAIGVIPADERIVVSQNKGIPVLSMHTKATRAFMTAARAFANPRVIPVDLNKEDPCIRQGKMVSSWCDYYLYGLLKTDLLPEHASQA